MFGRSTVYTRMEDSLLRGSREKLLRTTLVEASLIIGFTFLLGFLLFAAQFSGNIRWSLGIAIIGVLAIAVWLDVNRHTAEPRPLIKPMAAVRPRTGELVAFTSTVRRAQEGLTYSQVTVSSRARDAFAEHLRLVRGLSPEAMRRFQADPWALQQAFHDPVLESFLYLASPDSDERYRWVVECRSRGGFESSLNEVLKHMEAWR